jgi:hypothetical protein
MDPVTQTRSKTVSPWESAARIRGQGRAILNGRSGGMSHRMTIVLAMVTVLTVCVVLYMAVGCISMAGYVLFGQLLWVDVASNILMAVLGLGLVLPLLASLRRLACLMAAPDGEMTDSLPVSIPAATLGELFYPFTSFRAYGRTMAVAMEGMGFTLLSVGVPVLCLRFSMLGLESVKEHSVLLFAFFSTVAFTVCLALGLLAFFLSGCRAGFGYFVFVHESMSLSDVNRYYQGFARSLREVFCLRISLAGWYALSIVGLLVPFVIHAAPYGLCCAAVYSRSLRRRSMF